MPEIDKNKFQTEDAKKLQEIIDNFDVSNPLSAAEKWNKYIFDKNEALRAKHIEDFGDDLYYKPYSPDLSGSSIVTIESIDGGLNNKQIVLTGFNFSNANFSNANIENIYFNNCDFTKANFENASIEGSNVNNCKFINSNFNNFHSYQTQNASGEVIENVFTNNNFTNANFNGAEILTPNFVNNNMTAVYLGKIDSAEEILNLGSTEKLIVKTKDKFSKSFSSQLIDDYFDKTGDSQLPDNDYISVYESQKKIEGSNLSIAQRPQGLSFSLKSTVSTVLELNNIDLYYFDRSDNYLYNLSTVTNEFLTPLGLTLDSAYTKDKITFGYRLNYTQNLNTKSFAENEYNGSGNLLNLEGNPLGFEFYNSSLSHNLYTEYKANNYFNFSLGAELESQSPMKINQYYIDKQDNISYKPFLNSTQTQISLGSINDLGPLSPAGETFRFDPANIGFSNYTYGTGYGSYIFNYAPSGPEIPTNFINPINQNSTENLEYRYTGITLSNVNTLSLNAGAQFNSNGFFLGGNISYPIVSSFKITENEGSGVFSENNFTATRFNYVYYQPNANGQDGQVIADVYQSNTDVDIVKTTNSNYKKPIELGTEIGFKTDKFSISAELIKKLGSQLSYEDKTEVFVNGDKKAEFNVKEDQSPENMLSVAFNLGFTIPYKNLKNKKSDKDFSPTF